MFALYFSLTYMRHFQIYVFIMHLVQLGNILEPFLFATPTSSLTPVLFKIIIGTTVAAILHVKLQVFLPTVRGESPLYFRKAPCSLLNQNGYIGLCAIFLKKIHEPLLNHNLLFSIQGQSFHINIGIKLLCDYLSMSVFPSRLHVT